MTTNAPDDDEELRATAENPPTPESSPRQKSPDNPTLIEQLGNNGNANANKTGAQTAPKDESPDANPGENTSESGLQGWLPDDSDTDDGRTGILSTYTEVHALVLGLSAGVFAAQTGRFDEIAAIVGAGAAGNRAQISVPEKYRIQAKKELPYFVAGCAVGFVGARADALAGIEIGMGIGV